MRLLVVSNSETASIKRGFIHIYIHTAVKTFIIYIENTNHFDPGSTVLPRLDSRLDFISHIV
jgi:hypothetical protein